MYDRPLSFGDYWRLIKIGDMGMLGIFLVELLIVASPFIAIAVLAIVLP